MWLATAFALLLVQSLELEKNYFGPAVITEYSATTVIPPRMSFRREQSGNLLIEVTPATGHTSNP